MSRAVALPLDVHEQKLSIAGGSMIRRTIHPSGLRILTETVPAALSATIGFWIPSGSRDESEGTFGSTHFLEHLLFKGTAGRSALDIAIAFDSVGGEHNAVTAKEYTCYYAKVRDVHVDMAVDVLSDMLAGSLLDPGEFDLERDVILEELAMAADDPGDLVNERAFESVFGDHPLGRPIGADPAAIGAATRESVLAHYREQYRPERLVIAAAGGVDHDRLVERALAALQAAGWDLSGSAAPTPRRPSEQIQLVQGEPVVAVERANEQAHVMLAAPSLTATDPRRPALAILSAALGGGMSSRLFQEIREKRGLAYSVHSFAATFSDSGLFGLYAASAPAKAPAVAGLMKAELEAIAADGLTEEELRRGVGQLSGASALALEDSDTRMSRLGRSEIMSGEFVDLDELLRRYDEVAPGDVTALARELAGSAWSTAVVGPVAADRFTGAVPSGAGPAGDASPSSGGA
ncbi:MAG: pitrilysin family protein [Naasia sp.]